MKKILFVVLLLSACTAKQIDLSEQSKKEIIEADIAMCDLALREGFYTALLAYADDSVIKPEEGKLPVIGKAALAEHWKGKAGTKGISWAPFRAEASRSGDLGYTFGNWKFSTADSVFYGNYFTAWKKQTDGTWKFVVDGGNNTGSTSTSTSTSRQ
jgi:ketosteroid isomerase-like protein